MKKIVLILILFSFTHVYSQIEYSIGGGPNFSCFFWGRDTPQKVMLSFGGNINNQFEIPINDKIGFATGFGFSLKKSKYRNEEDDYLSSYSDYITNIYDLYTIDIPLRVKLYFNDKKTVFFSGIKIESILEATKKFKGRADDKFYIKHLCAPNFFSIDLGIEFKINKNINLGLQYNRNISNIFKVKDLYSRYGYGGYGSYGNYGYVASSGNSLYESDVTIKELNTFSATISYKFPKKE